jgi:hypothetical protein
MEESLARAEKPAQRRQGTGFLVGQDRTPAPSKDALEKYRVAERRECHTRFQPPKHPLQQFDAAHNPVAASDAEVYQTGAVQALHEQERARVKHYQVCEHHLSAG